MALFRQKSRAPKRRRIRKLRLLAVTALLGLLGLASFSFGLLTAIAAQIPELDPAKQHTQANTYVYADDGETVLAILRGSQARIVVPSKDISAWMKHSMVAIEDKRFYAHRGVDPRGMVRAVWADVTNRGLVQGGSTITQQFVKNAYVSNQRSISRKLREAALAWQLEQRWSKDRILTAYLNTIYFGNGAYGVEQASRVYFHHSAKTLRPYEAALLAGIPEDPTLNDPVAHPRHARRRRDLVLQQLYDQHYLTHRQLVSQLARPMPVPSTVTLAATQGQAPYFANYVKDQLVRKFGPRKVFGGGLRVKTTIDLRLQKLAKDTIASTLTDPNGPTAALVTLDVHTGAVLAMVGGENYHQNQFNLATQGERQPGSSFKPFVLATALRAGISPNTTFDSHKVTINASGRLWEVNNYEGEYLGPINLTQATAYSDNSVFAQLTNVVGPQNVKQTAKDLGITTPLKGYFAIGLGAEPATPLEMARAYSAFANGGSRIDGSIFGDQPRAVECLTDAKGRCRRENKPMPRQELTAGQAAIIDDLLQGVVRYGTGKAAQISGRQVAGKTGTTENYGDAWFVGFTPQYVTAVWVGYPDTLRPMLTEFHGKPVAGGTFPALIWKAFMEKALDKQPVESFPPPPSLYASALNVTNRNGKLERDNGVCRDTTQLVFFGGEEPKSVADCKPNEVDVPDVVGNSLGIARARLAAQPLSSTVVYKPAKPGQKLGVVVGEIPSNGTLSAGGQVTLVLAKSLHGRIPKLTGLTVDVAKARLDKLKVDVHVRGRGDGNIVAQDPLPGVASAPDLRVTLTTK